jgi:hypothetical protein
LNLSLTQSGFTAQAIVLNGLPIINGQLQKPVFLGGNKKRSEE